MSRYEDINDFFYGLSIQDKKSKIALRRSLGKGIGNANSRALLTYVEVVPDTVGKYLDYIWFEIACMYALNDCKNGERDFMRCLRIIDKGTGGIDNQVNYILSKDLAEDNLVLKNISKLIKRLEREGVNINLKSLLSDLIDWYYGDVSVKLKWAKQYKEDL